MRMILGVLSLLVVLAAVAVLASKQLKAVNSVTLPASASASASNPVSGAVLPSASPDPAAGNVQQQSAQIQQQIKAALDAAAQQTRVLPDEKP